MAGLCIQLLGPLEVCSGGEPLSTFRSDKVRALLAYLAAEAKTPHSREKLAGSLWPEWPERNARARLRRALTNLRRVIGDHQASPPFLPVSRRAIQFNRASDAWIDLVTFAEHIDESAKSAQAIVRLEKAIELYRGDFPEGFSVAACEAFEEWALLTRERARRLALDALRRLADAYERQQEYERALLHAWRQVELDPWREKAQQQLIRLLALNGQRSAALAQYEACRRVLHEELGVEPAAETLRLYEEIHNERLMVPSPGHATSAGTAPPAFQAPESHDRQVRSGCVGREAELAGLSGLMDLMLAGEGRAAFVTGEAGSGKTALLEEFALRAQEHRPDLVVALGNGKAYTGLGDPYLPFREALAMLCGDVEARWAAGAMGTDHARRLWTTMPLVVQALVQNGPDPLDTLVPGRVLLERTLAHESKATGSSPAWLNSLKELMEQGRPGRSSDSCARWIVRVIHEGPAGDIQDASCHDVAGRCLQHHSGQSLWRLGRLDDGGGRNAAAEGHQSSCPDR